MVVIVHIVVLVVTVNIAVALGVGPKKLTLKSGQNQIRNS